MSPLSWILAAVLVVAAVLWAANRTVLWGAVFGVLATAFVASLGWLWWWVPIVAAGIALIGYLIGLFLLSFGRVVLALVTILGILLAGIAGFNGLQNLWGGAPGGISSIAFDPEVDFLPAEAKCETNLFVDHSIRTVEPGNPEKKQFPTAVSVPFTGADDKAVLTEMTKTELCGNPTALEMVVNEMLLWSSADIPGADENKDWLNEIKADIDSTPFGIDSFVDKTPTGKLFVTETYQKYAAWVNTVLLRSVGEGQQSLTSIRNWEVSAVADPRGLPSATQAEVLQENKPAWVRSFIDKMGNCLLRFGFNAEDRRIEIFECPQPVNPEQPPTVTPPPGCVGDDCEPPPTFVCPPEQPHKAWSVDLNKWICKDDPSRDPEQQGNNRPGGGGLAPEQTDPLGPPAGGEPEPTYTPPAPVQTPAPEVTPIVIAPSSEPTVAPTEQPPADGEVVGSGTCSATDKAFGLCE